MAPSADGPLPANIPELNDGADWPTWKTTVELHVRAMNDEEHLTESSPYGMNPVHRKEWKRNDATIMSLLYGHCSLKVREQLANHISTAKDIWTRLHHLFDQSGFQSKITIINGLRHIKPADCGSIGEYLDAFEHQVNLCRTVADWKVEDNVACLFLLDDLADYLEYWCAVKRTNWRQSQSPTLASLIREAKDEAQLVKVCKTVTTAVLPVITDEGTTEDPLHGQDCSRQDTDINNHADESMYASKYEFKKDIEAAVASALQAQEQSHPATVVSENHTSPFPDIPEFDGDRSKYEAWRYQLNIKLAFDKRFGHDEDKAAYIMTRLRGQALSIFTYRPGEAVPKSSVEVIQCLDKFFDTRDKLHVARTKLDFMYQGNRPLAPFVIEFVSLAQRAEWDSVTTKKELISRLNYDLHPHSRKRLGTLNLSDLIDNLMDVVEYEEGRDGFVDHHEDGASRLSASFGGKGCNGT